MSETKVSVQAIEVQRVLEQVADWGKVATIIIHGGSVFEFMGSFPHGTIGEGYYNLKGETGFEGHLNLNKIAAINFNSGSHRGRESHHMAFLDADDNAVFKIFVGRDANGELLAAQLEKFKQLKIQWGNDNA